VFSIQPRLGRIRLTRRFGRADLEDGDASVHVAGLLFQHLGGRGDFLPAAP
jgi:hypothetical protein